MILKARGRRFPKLSSRLMRWRKQVPSGGWQHLSMLPPPWWPARIDSGRCRRRCCLRGRRPSVPPEGGERMVVAPPPSLPGCSVLVVPAAHAGSESRGRRWSIKPGGRRQSVLEAPLAASSRCLSMRSPVLVDAGRRFLWSTTENPLAGGCRWFRLDALTLQPAISQTLLPSLLLDHPAGASADLQ